uniref:Glutathione peroxidase 4 n=1 Tax=Coturnix japonica TaxID=93934 RepID=A0A8C2TGV4_COTJA
MGWGWRCGRALLCGAAAARGAGRTMPLCDRWAPQCAQADEWRSATSIYDFHATDIDGRDVALEQYRGFVCIITNVASK